MIDGNDILELGVPESPLVGRALAVAEAHEGTDEQALDHIERVFKNPSSYVDFEDEVGKIIPDTISGVEFAAATEAFARALREREKRKAFLESLAPMDEPVDHKTVGDELITEDTKQQMRGAMRLPPTVGGALMPDAHPIQPGAYPDYNLPVGGVWALEDAICPHAVGYDIGCSMMLSIYSADADKYLRENWASLKRALMEKTAFGRGVAPDGHRDHPIMSDPRWENLPDQLVSIAAAQLGSSGGSNHFVEWGVLELSEPMSFKYGALQKRRYLALLSHSGSRGIGPKICRHYKEKAMERCWGLPDEAQHLGWLPIEKEGQDYYRDMKLAGDWSEANHETIHNYVAKGLGLSPVGRVFNAHNLANIEKHGGRTVVVHRKGATPAHNGRRGIIPGSMGEPAALVVGKGSPETFDSASHGAGRTMSRSEAKESLLKKEEQARLQEKGIEILEGGLDDHPSAYKDIDDILKLQSDIVDTKGRFYPRIVRMSND